VKPAYVTVRDLGVRTLERREGISTEGYVDTDELGFRDGHRQAYKPMGWFTLRRILKRHEVTPDDAFLDLGSGKGRLVFQAARHYPFRRVVGVELSESLNAIARANIERNRGRFRAGDVELVTADVVDYGVPDDVTVAAIFNSVTGPLFDRVVGEIEASLERRPRRFRVIYGNPTEEHRLLGAGFEPVRRLRGLRPGRDWSRSNATRMYERAAS
jgi:SAM-dependent methyltransferase